MPPTGNKGCWDLYGKAVFGSGTASVLGFIIRLKRCPHRTLFFKPVWTLLTLIRTKHWDLLALRLQIQHRDVAVLHAFVEGRDVSRHDLLPRRQLLVQPLAQHFERFILLL